jgi:hypothetical protein
MDLRPGSLIPAIAVLTALAALSPPPASAQQGEECEGVPHCGPYSENPPEECNGPNDPFCNGGGGGPIATCSVCFHFPGGPNGEPAEYDCLDIAGSPRLKNCEAILNGCVSSGFCYLV